jgi:hypothetical protein
MESRNRFQGMNSASLCGLEGQYDNPIPPRFLAPIDSLKIQLRRRPVSLAGGVHKFYSTYKEPEPGFLGIPYTMFTLQNSFKPLLLKGRRELNPLVEVTVNSKEVNSQDFCSNYVQQFGLSTMPHSLRETLSPGQATFIRAWNYSIVQYSSSVTSSG